MDTNRYTQPLQLKTQRVHIVPASVENAKGLDALLHSMNEYHAFDGEGTVYDTDARGLLETGAVPPGGVAERFHVLEIWQGDALQGLVDYYCGYPDEGAVYLADLIFAPQVRGAGLGREVVGALLGEWKRQGFAEVRLAVSLRNWTGLRFWSRCGFSTIAKVLCEGNADTAQSGKIELLQAL